MFREKLKRIEWRHLELFLRVMDAGSFRAAKEKTGHAVGTIRSGIARIEDMLGTSIVNRTPEGLTLTPSGQRLHKVVQEMRLSRESVVDSEEDGPTPGRVRIAVTEGLGTYWLMPRLVEFQQLYPELDLELHCDMQRSDVAGGECDIAVQLDPPSDDSVHCARIGTLHLMPFAADRYLRSAGTPRSVDEWPDHRLVWQEADQVASHLLPYILGTADPSGLIGIRTNSSSAHFRAIATGGGIGILPTYARAISRRVRPLDLGVHLRREILCVTNAARSSAPDVRLVADWLAQCFDGEAYPWFRQDFVHPRDFEAAISSSNVISLFEGFIDGMDAEEPAA